MCLQRTLFLIDVTRDFVDEQRYMLLGVASELRAFVGRFAQLADFLRLFVL